jgi:outer membrane lipoprotein carrier protein
MMKIKLFKFLKPAILFLCILPVSLFADTTAPIDQLGTLLQKFTTMQANFTQYSYDNTGNLIQKSTGQMALQRPGKFRWKVTSPNKQLLVADGTYLWIYDIDLAQASKQQLKGAQTTNPATLISGSVDTLKQQFTVTTTKSKGATSAYKLTPIDKQSPFKFVELDFKSSTLSAIQIRDNLDQLTKINFSDIKTNTSLDSSLFQFKAPTGVDLVFNG